MQPYSCGALKENVLREMAEYDRRLIVERVYSRGKQKKEIITLRAASGKNDELKSPALSGLYWTSNLPIQQDLLNDYIHDGLVSVEHREPHRAVYKLTANGLRKGRSLL